jgi:putative nucleotidyltransferase with HDIG domain
MALITNAGMIDIMQRTLNYVDDRLVNHGMRVAYLMFKALSAQNRYSAKELRDICVLAMLHDIGAYKTEEIDKMVIFETVDVWEHSIYGYLFLKYFSPLKELAEVILYHHASREETGEIDPAISELAQLVLRCDRVDVSHIISGGVAKFNGEMERDAAFRQVLLEPEFTDEEIVGYIDMVIYSIDFRSSQTVKHTVTVASASRAIARLAGVTGEQLGRISVAAMLHDIGKISTPVNILESTGSLSDAEMEIMRRHVGVSEEILRGNVAEDIVNMAVNHHEKLNGRGYLKGLGEMDIAESDRIIAVADVLSALCYARSYKDAFPKEKVTGILTDMAERGSLDPGVVALVCEHYDEILRETDEAAAPVIDAYNRIKAEYEEIRSRRGELCSPA